jgi:hypothetical protein
VQCPVELEITAAVESVRWRWPLDASIELVPASAAKDASLAIRCGSPLDTSSCAAQIVPTPHSPSRSGAIWQGRVQPRFRHATEPTAEMIRRSHDHCVELVQRGGPRPGHATPPEQQHAQLLATTSTMTATRRRDDAQPCGRPCGQPESDLSPAVASCSTGR